MFHGPGIQMWDLSLFKQFKFTERYQLQFRAEFFNAFNHPNFANPNANISSPGSFGKVFEHARPNSGKRFRRPRRSSRDSAGAEVLLLAIGAGTARAVPCVLSNVPGPHTPEDQER